MRTRLAIPFAAAVVAITSSAAQADGQIHDAIHYCQPHEADQPVLIITSCLKAIDSNLLDRMALAQAWTNVGAAHLELKQYDKAIMALNHAIESDPKMWRAYGDRGVAEAETGKLDAAETDIDTAIQLAPNEPSPLLTRGELYLGEEKFDKAQTDFSSGIAMDAKNVPAYYYRAMAWDKLGNKDLAAKDRAMVKMLDPDNKTGLPP